MVVDEGKGDGKEGEGFEVVSPAHPPPSPQVAPQSPEPADRHRPEGVGDRLVSLSKKKCFSNSLGYTLVVLEML